MNVYSYDDDDDYIDETPLRLYMLRYGKYGPPVKDPRGVILYYNDKATAKQDRDELNANLSTPIFVVTTGPDHKHSKPKSRS